MNAARGLLGVYVPGRTPWHRMPVGWKYVAFLVLTVPAVVSANPWVVVGTLAVTLAAVASTRAPPRIAWGLPVSLLVLFAILAGYHVLVGQPWLTVTVVGTMLVAIYASRILLITTPMPRLVDALTTAVRPLRHVGLDPERFGLAVAIVLRSIPVIYASFGDVRDAARARGLQRNPVAQITPVVVQAIAFARTTGDALVARGLGEASDA